MRRRYTILGFDVRGKERKREVFDYLLQKKILPQTNMTFLFKEDESAPEEILRQMEAWKRAGYGKFECFDILADIDARVFFIRNAISILMEEKKSEEFVKNIIKEFLGEPIADGEYKRFVAEVEDFERKCREAEARHEARLGEESL